jgi:uncharacterized protein with beta-barrel porin domain
MRINKLQLAGLAAVLAGGVGAENASANDRTISTATTTPVTTSQPEPPGNVTPGDVTIAVGGSITVAATQTGVTVNSNNDVSNAGFIASNNANDTTGILLQGGFAGPLTIANTGTINLLEDYTLADTNSDGDLDGAFATRTNLNGIRLSAGPAFNGDVANSGSIRVEGELSAGIRLDALLNGELRNTGAISITGDDSTGIAILGGALAGVTGDVLARGGVTAIGEGARGLLVGAPVSGELRISGGWNVTGYHSTTRPDDVSQLEAEDLLQSGSAVDVRFSVLGGITIEGTGVEDDLDDDGDGLIDGGTDTDDDASASITVYGAAPAVLIQADPTANLVLGATPALGGWGLNVRGAISALGLYDGFEATAIRIQGSGGGQTVTTAAGVALDSNIFAFASAANAYGVYIGADASVPSLLVRRSLTANVNSETAQTAYGVYLAANAIVPSFNNSGIVSAQLFGEAGDATSLIDLSNTLATITNSGTIISQIFSTDTDPNDAIPPPPIAGTATAIDVSASTINVTYNQIAEIDNVSAALNDDDAVDDDALLRPDVLTRGYILFGSGNDTVNLLAGAIEGGLSFGNGADTFNINNGATYGGVLTDTDGLLTLNVLDGTLAIQGDTINITTATFGANGVLSVQLSETLGESTLILASGDVTFLAGASIVPVAPAGLPTSGSHTFLTAGGSLIGGANVERIFSGAGSPWLYNFEVAIDAGDPNSLVADYIRKTPTQLGLNANQSIAFLPLVNALALNTEAAAALAAIDNEADFFNAYEDLMPSFASASTELAATAIQQAQSATTNRLAATRLHDLDEVSVWAQEIGYNVSRQPVTANGQQFGGQGFGVAAGIDGPLENGGLFGLSGSFITSEATEDGRPEGEISSSFGQFNAYLGTAMGPLDLDFIGGVGVGKMTSRRFVEIGSAFNSLSEADWWSYEGHGGVRASAPMRLTDWMVITPQAALTYVALSESGYTESGGGAGIDYEAEAALSQRLWGDLGVEFSARFNMGVGSYVAPRLYAGYRANMIDEQAERTFRFASGSPDFTLTDESLGSGGPLVGVGIDATNGYSTFSLAYEGEFGDQIERHSLNAAIRFRF